MQHQSSAQSKIDPQQKIENLKLALQAQGEAPPSEGVFG